MNIDIRTLAIVLAITSVIQVFAFLLQYLVNKTYRGIGWWALGWALVALGWALLLLRDRDVVSLVLISIIIPNASLVLGAIFIYFGTRRFFHKKVHGEVVLSIFAAFLLCIVYYTYVNSDITARTAVLAVTIAIIAFMIAHCLFENRTRPVSASVYFTSAVFFILGCQSTFRALTTLTISPVNSLFTPSLMQASGFLVPLVIGISATFGLIIMVNQRSNAEMKEAKEKFEGIFITSPDVSLITRLQDGVIVNVNDGFINLHGFSRNDLIGKSTLDAGIWVHPYERQKLIDEIREKGYCLNYEAAFRIGANSQIIGLTSAKIVSLNNIPHIISVTHDITERKRAEEALLESEERQSFLLELSDRLRPLSDALKIMNAASEVLARRLGLTSVGYCEIKEDGETVARGEYSDGRMPSRDNFCFRQSSNSDFIRSLRAGEDLFYEDNRNNPRAGSENVVLGGGIQIVAGAAIPLLKDGRLVAYLYAVHPDPRPWPDKERRLMREVAERTWGAVQRARAEKALRESEQRYKSLNAELEQRVSERTAQLERKNRELQEFAFVASHDLSEPLRKIQTFGTFLQTKNADDLNDETKDYVSRMVGAANRMQELLNALLSYSRIETKGQEFRPTSLNDVVKNAAADLEILIQNIGARVEIGPLPLVMGDSNQLRQLFQNLISNALKYYRSEVKPHIKIFGEEENGASRIFVEDNGIGFEEKYLDKIFQSFQRLHGRNEYPGIGMGLAICRKIVDRHCGTITAKSAPGKGSTFIITLPVK